MNKELIKLSENLGAVTNECGDVKIVEVNQNSNNLEKILLKENELENMQSKICSLQKNLEVKNLTKIMAIFLGLIFCLISLPFSIYLVLDGTNELSFALLKTTPFIFEGIIPITLVGNPVTFSKKLRELKSEITNLEEELNNKQKELKDLKKVSEFKKAGKSNDITKPKTNEAENTENYSLNNNDFNKENVKVLRLVPKNNSRRK